MTPNPNENQVMCLICNRPYQFCMHDTIEQSENQAEKHSVWSFEEAQLDKIKDTPLGRPVITLRAELSTLRKELEAAREAADFCKEYGDTIDEGLIEIGYREDNSRPRKLLRAILERIEKEKK